MPQAVYLVGGFAASPYLISFLKQRLASTGVELSVPDGQTYVGLTRTFLIGFPHSALL